MRVTKLSPSQRVKGRWLVQLENGDLLRVTENEVVAFSLYAGMDLDEETREALTAAAAAAGHREYALRLLSARPLSRAELVRKLADKDCPPQEAEAIADRLCELGYLNDEQYARALVRHYAAKGYGPYKIKDELYRRGVPKSLWDEALEEREDPADALDAFLAKKLRNIDCPDRKDLKRASDALARRGYAWQDIRAALRRYGAELDE